MAKTLYGSTAQQQTMGRPGEPGLAKGNANARVGPMKRAKSPSRLQFDPIAFLSKQSGTSSATFRKNQVVFSQGDLCGAMYYVQKGQAKVTVVSTQGKEAVLTILNPGEFFGEACLKGNKKHLSTVRAMTECEVIRISPTAMSHAIQTNPKFADLFIAHLLIRTSRVEADLVDQLFNSSEKRLARALLLLANFGKTSDPVPVLPKISQETLAEMIGTTRARVSFFMNKFRKLGLIEYNGHIEVHQSLLNVVLHEKPEITRS